MESAGEQSIRHRNGCASIREVIELEPWVYFEASTLVTNQTSVAYDFPYIECIMTRKYTPKKREWCVLAEPVGEAVPVLGTGNGNMP